MAKLLPKEKVLHHTDRLSLINKDGRSYFIPADEKEAPTINSFGR